MWWGLPKYVVGFEKSWGEWIMQALIPLFCF